jgi:transposase
MHIKTVLNRIHKIKGFVYEKVHFRGDHLEVQVRPRKGSKPICSGCEQAGPGYDTLDERYFKFVPLWGITVYLLYAMRRVACSQCGITVEQVPWAAGKRRLTIAYALFLSAWAKRLSWKEVASIFRTSWNTVYRSVAWVVDYGLKRRNLDGITAIGVDEVQFQKGHRYLTVVYQIDSACRRLLWIGPDRSTKTLLRFFKMLGRQRTTAIQFVCSDMWKPYLKVIAQKASQAIHILDRFHVVARLNKALDEIRAAEARRLAREGYEPVLKHARWCLLKKEENLTDKQWTKLNDVLQYDLKSVRGYLLKQGFQLLWEYTSPYWAGRFLDGWLKRAMRSRLEPIKKVAKSIRKHRELILNWFKAKKKFSCGIVEGMNYNIKLSIRKAYGYKSLEVAEVALYHRLAMLPEPELTHRFW